MASRKVSSYGSTNNEVSKQTGIAYWENKSTGDYVRETATQRYEGGSSTRYQTTTVGNKQTGEFSTVQTQQGVVDGFTKVVHQDNLTGKHSGYEYLKN